MNKFGLTEEHQKILQNCFLDVLEDQQSLKVWIFGSRARNTHRPFSDVDLLLEANPHLTSSQVLRIKDALEESNLPFKFDLVVLAELYPPYADQIHREKRLLFQI